MLPIYIQSLPPNLGALIVTFCDFLSKFRKKTAKNTKKPDMLPNCYVFLTKHNNYVVTTMGFKIVCVPPPPKSFNQTLALVGNRHPSELGYTVNKVMHPGRTGCITLRFVRKSLEIHRISIGNSRNSQQLVYFC